MEKLEVLRSDIAVKSALYNTENQEIQNALSDVNIPETKISELLQTADIDNTQIKDLVDVKASANPLENVRHNQAVFYYKDTVLNNGDGANLNYICDEEYLQNQKNNKPLQNNYFDAVRGAVIKVDAQQAVRQTEVTTEMLEQINQGNPISSLTGNKRCEYGNIFIANEAMRDNMISNVFAGKNLPNGCSMSFWVAMSKDAYAYGSSVITFVSPTKKFMFAENSEESVLTNAWLYFDTKFGTYYFAPFRNHYRAERKPLDNKYYAKNIARADRQWFHIILSFTNEDIKVYLNGAEVSIFKRTTGKRFGSGKGSNNPDGAYQGIVDFITSEDTRLYFGTTISNDYLAISDAFLFDDIVFYSEPVTSDEDAMDTYKQALEINIP